MDMMLVIGIVASVCTGSSLVPQLFKTYREKRCDVSTGMLTVLFVGNACWIWYGILKSDAIIIASNAFSVLANLIVWVMRLSFGRGDKKEK